MKDISLKKCSITFPVLVLLAHIYIYIRDNLLEMKDKKIVKIDYLSKTSWAELGQAQYLIGYLGTQVVWLWGYLPFRLSQCEVVWLRLSSNLDDPWESENWFHNAEILLDDKMKRSILWEANFEITYAFWGRLWFYQDMVVFLQSFLAMLLFPVRFSSCQAVLSSCEVVLMWGHFPVRSPSFRIKDKAKLSRSLADPKHKEALKIWQTWQTGRLPVRLSSCVCCLYVRSSEAWLSLAIQDRRNTFSAENIEALNIYQFFTQLETCMFNVLL